MLFFIILFIILFLALMLLHDILILFHYFIILYLILIHIDDSLMLVIYPQCTDDKMLRCYQVLGWKKNCALMLLCYIIIYFIHVLSSEMLHRTHSFVFFSFCY